METVLIIRPPETTGQPAAGNRISDWATAIRNCGIPVHVEEPAALLLQPPALAPRVGGRLKRAWASSKLRTIAVPDIQIGKWRRSAEELLATIEDSNNFGLILTSGPPHSIHEAGRILSERLGIPWIADWRDPYTIDMRYAAGGLRLSRHRRYESIVYDRCAASIHAIPSHARWARRQFPSAASSIASVTAGVPRVPAQRASSGVGIGIFGSADATVVARLGAAARTIGEQVVWYRSGRPASALPNVIIKDPISSERMTHALQDYRILATALDSRRSRGRGISRKLFDYLSTQAPILLLRPSKSEWFLVRRGLGIWGVTDTGENSIAELLRSVVRSEPFWTESRRSFARRYAREKELRKLTEIIVEVL